MDSLTKFWDGFEKKAFFHNQPMEVLTGSQFFKKIRYLRSLTKTQRDTLKNRFRELVYKDPQKAQEMMARFKKCYS